MNTLQDYLEAGYIFKVCDEIVSSVMKTWLRFMYLKLGHPLWRKRMFTRFVDLPKPLPEPFRNPWLERVRVVIDCTSIRVKSTQIILYLIIESNQV